MSKKHALLIVDMINDFQFPKGQQLANYAKNIIPPIHQLKELCHERHWPVIYINDHYGLWKADIQLIKDHASNSTSASIIKEIEPGEADYFLIKAKHSAFYGTSLQTLLRELDVESVIVTGLAGNICVFFTANDAYMREFDVVVPSDAIASEEKTYNEYALDMMKTVLQADTRSAAEWIDSL